MQHGKIAKAKSFFNLNVNQKICQLPMQCAKALFNLGIVAILHANIRKSQQFHRFELVHNLVSSDLRFNLFRLFLI